MFTCVHWDVCLNFIASKTVETTKQVFCFLPGLAKVNYMNNNYNVNDNSFKTRETLLNSLDFSID